MVKPNVLVHKASPFDVHVLVGEAALVSDGVGQSLLSVAQNHIPDISSASLLRLELVNFPEDIELPTVTLLSATLLAIWEKSYSKLRISPYDIRATLEAMSTH